MCKCIQFVIKPNPQERKEVLCKINFSFRITHDSASKSPIWIFLKLHFKSIEIRSEIQLHPHNPSPLRSPSRLATRCRLWLDLNDYGIPLREYASLTHQYQCMHFLNGCYFAWHDIKYKVIPNINMFSLLTKHLQLRELYWHSDCRNKQFSSIVMPDH